MEATMDLMGPAAADADRQQDLQKAALDCLKKTVSFVWCTLHYPPGNKAIADAGEAWKEALSHVLTMRSSFLLALLKTRLYFEDTLLNTHDDMSTGFVKEMSDRRIRKIIFWRGVTEGELERFSVILSGKAKELLEKGGPLAVLRKQRVKNIEIVENEYEEEEEEEELEYWEQKLKKMGLDKNEIVDFMFGKKPLPRLLTDEMRLLVEAMKDPLFLSQIIVRIAAMEAGGRSPGPGELFRICKRVQYILLANSLFDPKETPRILTRAAQAFDPKLRLQLLAEKLRVEADGTESVDDRTFAFSPDEYANHIVRGYERGGDWPQSLGSFHCAPAIAERLGQSLRARLMTSPGWDGDDAQTGAEIAGLLSRIQSAVPTNGGPPAEMSTLPKPDEEAADEALRGSCETLHRDLGDGYVHALLGMIAGTKDQERAGDVFDRLIDLLVMRLDTGMTVDALRLLPMVFGPELSETRQKWLKNRFREGLPEEHKGKLAAGVVSELMDGNEEALDAANVMSDIFGQEFRQGVLSAFFAEAAGEPSATLLSFLGGYEGELLPILRGYVKNPDSMTRVRAIELLAAFDSKPAQDLIVAGFDDSDRHVRIITSFTLGRGSGPQGIAGLMAAAQRGSIPERCAAVWSLGKLRKEHCISMLTGVVAKRNWVRKKKGAELKACAALALKDIGAPQSIDVLRKHIDTMHLTRLDLVIAWLEVRLRIVIRVIKAVVNAVVATVVAIYRAIVWVLLLPIRLPLMAVRGISAMLKSLGGRKE